MSAYALIPIFSAPIPIQQTCPLDQQNFDPKPESQTKLDEQQKLSSSTIISSMLTNLPSQDTSSNATNFCPVSLMTRKYKQRTCYLRTRSSIKCARKKVCTLSSINEESIFDATEAIKVGEQCEIILSHFDLEDEESSSECDAFEVR